MLMPFFLALLKRFPTFTKRMMWCGMFLCVSASLGASISTKVCTISFLHNNISDEILIMISHGSSLLLKAFFMASVLAVLPPRS